MTLDNYQVNAVVTAIYPGMGTFIGLSYCALKLNGEAGEVAEHIGEALRDDARDITPARRVALKKELGDVLWYIAALSSELGYDLSEIARENLKKLADRKARGVLRGSGDER